MAATAFDVSRGWARERSRLSAQCAAKESALGGGEEGVCIPGNVVRQRADAKGDGNLMATRRSIGV